MQSSAGVDRFSGRALSGWPHVVQSLQVIFTTRFGERAMREWFGSFVPNVLGERMVPSAVLKFWTAICVAIDLWEPRFKVTKIEPFGSAEDLRLGAIGFRIEGVYMPLGHLGDTTPEREVRSFRLGAGGVLR